MKYQLIALDVDGTLLNDHHQLTDRTIRTIRRVHEEGATIVLCTGRGPGNAIPVMDELGLEGTVITHNGAATIRTKDRAIVHQYPFPISELPLFLDYCREHRIHFDVNTPFHMYVDVDPEQDVQEMYRNFMIEPVRVPDIRSIPEMPVKFTVYDKSKERMDRVEADWKTFDTGLNVIRSGEHFIDVMHGQASKGNALRELASSLGIDRSRVLAIGNYFNDLDMIQFAGMGIAMDNSPDEVKRRADAVTASNNEEGVHLALLKYCLE